MGSLDDIKDLLGKLDSDSVSGFIGDKLSFTVFFVNFRLVTFQTTTCCCYHRLYESLSTLRRVVNGRDDDQAWDPSGTRPPRFGYRKSGILVWLS